MAEGQDILKQVREEEVVVVRRTFAILLVRNFLLLEVEVVGVLTVVGHCLVAMVDIHQVVKAVVVLMTIMLLEEVVDLKLQVVLLVAAVDCVQQQTMGAVVLEDLVVFKVHIMLVLVEVVDTLEAVVLILEEVVVVPAILITLQSAPLVSIQAMDMR